MWEALSALSHLPDSTLSFLVSPGGIPKEWSTTVNRSFYRGCNQDSPLRHSHPLVFQVFLKSVKLVVSPSAHKLQLERVCGLLSELAKQTEVL